MITLLPDGRRTTANVRRAILASLDRMDAERRADEASEELSACTHLELLARASLDGSEAHDYALGLTLALNERQEATQTRA